MIDPALLNAYPATPGAGIGSAAQTGAAKPRLHMRRDPDARMAGSVPVWESAKAAARKTPDITPDTAPDFKTALHQPPSQPPLSHNGEDYNDIEPALGADTGNPDDEFGFEDLIDIINPLHHIPLVNIVYQNVTGDTIKPAGRIIGGAVFGGFAGAAAGIANVIVEEETGKDMTGNVVAMIRDGTLPKAKPGGLSPEEQLDQAARMAFGGDITAEELPPLPAMALGLQQPPASNSTAQSNQPRTRYDYVRDEDDRMAGNKPIHKSRTEHIQQQTAPLPRANLIAPVSVNLAQIRADQAGDVTSLHLTPLPPPQ